MYNSFPHKIIQRVFLSENIVDVSSPFVLLWHWLSSLKKKLKLLDMTCRIEYDIIKEFQLS
jgi:hypothetical protein